MGDIRITLGVAACLTTWLRRHLGRAGAGGRTRDLQHWRQSYLWRSIARDEGAERGRRYGGRILPLEGAETLNYAEPREPKQRHFPLRLLGRGCPGQRGQRAARSLKRVPD